METGDTALAAEAKAKAEAEEIMGLLPMKDMMITDLQICRGNTMRWYSLMLELLLWNKQILL